MTSRLLMIAGSFVVAGSGLLAPIDKCSGNGWTTPGVAPVDPCPQSGEETPKPKPPVATLEAF